MPPKRKKNAKVTHLNGQINTTISGAAHAVRNKALFLTQLTTSGALTASTLKRQSSKPPNIIKFRRNGSLRQSKIPS